MIPDYKLIFKDALTFSFVELVGKAIEDESKVLFLTKDGDFDIERVKERVKKDKCRDVNLGECLQRIKKFIGTIKDDKYLFLHK